MIERLDWPGYSADRSLVIVPDPRLAFGGRLRGLPTLHEAWEFTRRRLEAIAEALHDALAPLEPLKIAVFLAGSYGRLEAVPPSDADPIIVYGEVPGSATGRIVNAIRGAFAALQIPASNPRGVFQEQYPLAELVNVTGGHADNVATLSQRMLLLMEARCVYGQEFGGEVIDALLDLYFQYHEAKPSKEAVFLLNDAIRYFRQLCVNYQFTFTHEREKWALRNVKLRHSRVAMYMGLLLLVLEASAPDHAAAKRDYLARELPYPPLARITRVLDAIDEPGIAEAVLSRYDRFLAGIADATARQRLQLEYEERDAHQEYATLKQNSNALIAALAGAVYGQRGRGRWTDRVFEYLLL